MYNNTNRVFYLKYALHEEIGICLKNVERVARHALETKSLPIIQQIKSVFFCVLLSSSNSCFYLEYALHEKTEIGSELVLIFFVATDTLVGIVHSALLYHFIDKLIYIF